MNDFDYECLQRKNLARQAKYKKNGSKSRRCSLPSDRMTKKQWKERCGPVNTYRLGDPMTWDEFKNMPDRYQAEYITNLQTKYGASAVDLAEMFGVSPRSVRNYLSEKVTGVKLKKGNSMNAERRAEWSRFLGGAFEEAIQTQADEEVSEVQMICEDVEIDGVNTLRDTETAEQEPETEVIQPVIAEPVEMHPVAEKPLPILKMDRIHMKFSGMINIDSLAEYLKQVLGDSTEAEMEIVCNFK